MRGTHTFTKVGIVDNSDLKQTTGSILLLEKKLDDAHSMLCDLREEGMDAFTTSYQVDMEVIIQEISDLLSAQAHHVHHLTTFHHEHHKTLSLV